MYQDCVYSYIFVSDIIDVWIKLDSYVFGLCIWVMYIVMYIVMNFGYVYSYVYITFMVYKIIDVMVQIKIQ